MDNIKIVVPDGSMQEVVMALFSKAGMPVVVKNKRTKDGKVAVDWIESVVFQRPQEIPFYLNNGHFDVAIVGEDWIANWGYEFPVLFKMGIGRGGNKPVRIVLAVDQNSGIDRVDDLPKDCEIATEYVGLAKSFFSSNHRNDVQVIPSYGNTEHKIRFGMTAIVDVTESGDSLSANGLKIICELMESNTVVVANPKSFADEKKRPYIFCFARFINGAFQASKYVMLVANVPENVLNKANQIIGGLKGPSCSPLVGISGWFALQSIIPREKEQETIFNLLQIGVTDIIVNRDIPLIMT